LRVIWLLASNHAQARVASLTGYSTRQIRVITKRYNEGGPEALGDRRRCNVGSKPLLDAVGQAELALALSQPPSEGAVWTGRKVAAWIVQKTGREAVPAKRGWAYRKRISCAGGHGRKRGERPERPRRAPKLCPE
jgi:Helix-turn-helix domain